jgi:oligosaccharide repeat unit polymerase
MDETGTVVTLAALAAANYFYRRSVLYPPFVFTGVWFFVLFVYRFHFIPMDILHSGTLNVIVLGALVFTVGGIAAFLVPNSLLRVQFTLWGNPRGQGSRIKWLLIAGLSCGLIYQILYLLKSSGTSGGIGSGILIAARNNMIDEANRAGSQSRLFTYVSSWAIFSAVLFQLEKRDRTFKLMATIAMLSALASTGRGQILYLLLALSGVFLIQTKRETFLQAFKLVRWPALGFGFLFILLMFTNKDTSNLTISPTMYITHSLVGYICGSVAALDLVLRHPSDYLAQGSLPGTLRTIFTLASSLKIMPYTPPPAFEDYVFVPFPINTFTVYKSFFTDYGLYSSVLVMGLIGFLHTLLYRKARTGSTLGMYLFGVGMYPLFLVFFVDAYSSLSLHAHAFLFAVVYLGLRSFPFRLLVARPHLEILHTHGLSDGQ